MGRIDRRAQIKSVVRYLRGLREVVKRAAAEHARWVRFIAEAASLLRASPSPYRTPDVKRAGQYAALFAEYHGFLDKLSPPDYCRPLHDSALAWLDALDLLASGVKAALDAGSAPELDSIVRGAGEAQIRLRTFQRMHAKTAEGIRQLYRQRPKPARPSVQLRTALQRKPPALIMR